MADGEDNVVLGESKPETFLSPDGRLFRNPQVEQRSRVLELSAEGAENVDAFLVVSGFPRVCRGRQWVEWGPVKIMGKGGQLVPSGWPRAQSAEFVGRMYASTGLDKNRGGG